MPVMNDYEATAAIKSLPDAWENFGLNSPILFLDEPLSNLDKKTQENVVAYIRKLKGEKTILVVMHSDELDEAADSVIYIENKKLIQK